MSKLPAVTVDSIMTSEVHVITPDMTVQQAIGLLLKYKISGAPVVDQLTKVISMISEGDAMKLAATSGLDTPIHQCLEKLLTPSQLVTLRRTATFADLYRTFMQENVHRIIIIDSNGKLLGLVSRSNVLRLLYSPKEEVKNAGAPGPAVDTGKPVEAKKTA